MLVGAWGACREDVWLLAVAEFCVGSRKRRQEEEEREQEEEKTATVTPP